MSDVFRTVLGTSISAAIVALMVIAARLIVGRRPGAILRLLFLLLMIRLAVPVPIQSPLSIQNLFDSSVSQYLQAPESPHTDIEGADNGHGLSAAKEEPAVNTLTAANTGKNNADKSDGEPLPWTDICATAWLCGVAAFSALLITGNLRFMKILRKNRGYDAPGFNELFSNCKSELGLNQRIETVRVSGISTAAVYGFLRPKLLISPSFENLSGAEKRHVLIHELTHIKRRDNLFCLMASVLSIAYWFNPLIWAAFALMRKDIEVICDAEALKKIGDRRAYAQTLLRLAQSAHSDKPRLVFALFISTDAIKRRIKMIALNKKNSVLFTVLGLILIVATAVCGCTGAVQPSTAPPESSPQISPAESGSDVFMLKDGSISVTIPEGWEAKDLSDDEYSKGMIRNKEDKNHIEIDSTDTIGWDTTPDTIMENTGFGVGYSENGDVEPEVEMFNPSIVSESPLSVDGLDGKLFEITATFKYNGADQQGYFAVFVGNGKSYDVFYLSDPNEFEANKDTVKSVIMSAKFN